jgi:hypothetical protein
MDVSLPMLHTQPQHAYEFAAYNEGQQGALVAREEVLALGLKLPLVSLAQARVAVGQQPLGAFIYGAKDQPQSLGT